MGCRAVLSRVQSCPAHVKGDLDLLSQNAPRAQSLLLRRGPELTMTPFLSASSEVVWVFWTGPIVNLCGGVPPLKGGYHR